MNDIAIVALPPVDDRAHEVSSEKVAHLTLLFLGDTDLSAEAVLYIQHACSELSPFGLSVDYRGTLGDKDADVLFFSKTAWDMKRVKEFRHHLLLNDEIKKAFDAIEQFPEWTPHLTLGYPNAPAKEYDDGDRRLHYVDFDRIAVWSGDFEGPEFRLEYEDYSVGEVAMSDMTTVDRGVLAAAAILSGDPASLKQYGKKGMKWGVTTVDKAASVTKTREKQALLGPKDVTVSQRRPGKFVTAKGGQRQVATPEAIKAAAGRQKAKKSTVDALTNDELADTIKRMQLETQFTKLSRQTARQNLGRKFAEALLGNEIMNMKIEPGKGKK